jgi:hypothetical protein
MRPLWSLGVEPARHASVMQGGRLGWVGRRGQAKSPSPRRRCPTEGCLLVVPQDRAKAGSENQEGAMAMRRTMVAVVAAVTLVWSAVPAMATLTPVKVVGGPANQYWPSSNGTYVAWTRQVNGRDTGFVKELPNGTPERLPGGQASFVGSSNVLVYTSAPREAKGTSTSTTFRPGRERMHPRPSTSPRRGSGGLWPRTTTSCS